VKKATVFMKGGFGNQLFQLCMAHYLKEHGFDVKINTDLFKELKSDTPRELTLPLENFGFTEQTLFSKFQFNSLLKINSNRYIKKSILKSLFRDYKFTKDNDDILNQTNKKIFLNGYWKDTKYIENSTEWLTSSIKKNEIIKDAWKSTLDENRAMIHIRRGDFIKDDRELKVSYYEKSINLLRRQNSQLKFDIFTDDEQWVQDQSIFSLSDNIYAQQSGKNINNEIPGIDGKDDSEETIKTFSQMLNYKHFIAGNSSFAFWAAFIRSDMTSLVTVPKPWFRNNDHPTLHKAHWNIINNT
jgi:hypothetical protein